MPEQSDVPISVLYVEDNSANIRLMTRIFQERPGIELHVASDGASAVELAPTPTLRLVLVDLNLPDVTGEELIPQLQVRFERPATPVVVLSADATSQRMQSLQSLGISAYLTKPYDIDELLRVIDTYCDVAPG